MVNAAWALHRNPLAVVACFTGAGLLCRSCLVVVGGPLCCEAVVVACLPVCCTAPLGAHLRGQSVHPIPELGFLYKPKDGSVFSGGVGRVLILFALDL